MIFVKVLHLGQHACMLCDDHERFLSVFHVEQTLSSGENRGWRMSRVRGKVWITVLPPYDLRAMT
jgi:hypothetical protein